MAAPTNVLSGTPATLVPGGADVPADLAALTSQVPTPTVAQTASVSHKAITSNVATLTTVAIHGFSVGDSVVVAGVDATFNGTYTITSVPSLISFTYAKTNANVVRATATGSASKTVTSPIWVDGAYVDLDDSSTAYWDGDSWAAGVALPDFSYDHNDGWQHQPGGYGLTVATDVRY
jgi:hypothetical protein